MANLEVQKKGAESLVYNIMLGDKKLGPLPSSPEETMLFLGQWTYAETLHDLFHIIMRISKN